MIWTKTRVFIPPRGLSSWQSRNKQLKMEYFCGKEVEIVKTIIEPLRSLHPAPPSTSTTPQFLNPT
ncbi:UNVERIFIED_CONTAM: hypothetical protein GTU68_062594 [Idotea baltica]|nr:hypothetical protein [Idotea baltica]